VSSNESPAGGIRWRPRLLIADDHHLVLDAFRLLAGDEYEVSVADNLRAFEEGVRSLSPEIAVLDIAMPDGDAIELARRVLLNNSDLKLIFLSMHQERNLIKRAMQTGAKGYVFKRGSAEELLFAIRVVLNGGVHVDELDEEQEKPSDTGEIALTARQKEVLRLIAQGCSSKEIGNRLKISVRTAEFHRAAIMDRLKLHSTALMTRYALDKGLD